MFSGGGSRPRISTYGKERECHDAGFVPGGREALPSVVDEVGGLHESGTAPGSRAVVDVAWLVAARADLLSCLFEPGRDGLIRVAGWGADGRGCAFCKAC